VIDCTHEPIADVAEAEAPVTKSSSSPPTRSVPAVTVSCTGSAEGVAERPDVIPAQFRAILTRRPRYGCRACESAVVQAPALARLIEGGLPTEALVAHLLVGKCADHLPLYQQSQIYARQEIELDRSTLAVRAAASRPGRAKQARVDHLRTWLDAPARQGPSPAWPRPSANALKLWSGLCSFSTAVASRSTPTGSSGRSARSLSTARTRSSPAPIRAEYWG
jgi:transposase